MCRSSDNGAGERAAGATEGTRARSRAGWGRVRRHTLEKVTASGPHDGGTRGTRMLATVGKENVIGLFSF
jgi:hypothetical protein